MKTVLLIVTIIILFVVAGITSGKVTPNRYQNTTVTCPNCDTTFHLKDSK